MPIATTVVGACAALGLEAAFGYPQRHLQATIGHPATWMGALISKLDRCTQSSTSKRRPSPALRVCWRLLIIVAIPAGIAWFIERALASDWAGNLVLAVFASTLLASRSLYDHVRDVAARSRNAEGSTRRALRSAASSDAIRKRSTSTASRARRSKVLPRMRPTASSRRPSGSLVLGLPGLAAYKAINTADSMIGHRTPRHEAFGWAAARFDDLVNLPASRLTGLLFAAAALVVPGASARDALRAMARDARRHRSPNAGWPESAMAGALGLKLNGPKNYARRPRQRRLHG